MNNSINNRINTLVEQFCDGNNSKFASIVNTSEANIRNYRSSTNPKLDVLVAICKSFKISYEWMLAGEGVMLHNDMPPLSTTEAQELYNRLLIRYEKRIEELNREVGALKERFAVAQANNNASDKVYDHNNPTTNDMAADGDKTNYKIQSKKNKKR